MLECCYEMFSSLFKFVAKKDMKVLFIISGSVFTVGLYEHAVSTTVPIVRQIYTNTSMILLVLMVQV